MPHPAARVFAVPRPTSLPPALSAVAAVVTGLAVGVLALPVSSTAATADASASSGPARESALARADPPRQALAGRTAARAEADPLEVQLTSLAPAVVPERGRIRVRGTITNRSTEEWTEVNLHAFRSTSPITGSAELAEAAATEPDEAVGVRITAPGTFDTVPTLLPGETTDFSLTISATELGITREPGVYWFGVHALGAAASTPRDGFSDGRARTFLPLVERTRRPVESAVVVPIRGTVKHRRNGQVAGVAHWVETLSEGGRLHDLLDSASAADAAEATWLVDPAIPAAVAQLAEGNPTRSLAPDPEAPPREDADGETEGTDEGGGTESPSPSPDDAEEVEPDSGGEDRVAELAGAWLDDFRNNLSGESVLALPYGDVDVEAAAVHGEVWYERGVQRAAATMEELGVSSDPAMASRTGLLNAPAIEAAAPRATVLLSDTAFVAPPDAPSSVIRLLDQHVVVTSSGAASGGPGPESPYTPIALRQRMLSEAALRLVDGSRTPLVTVLPDDWHPTGPTDLFGALSQSWLEPVAVSDVATGEAATTSADSLVYTAEDRAAQLGQASFAAANDYRATAQVLDGVLASASVLPEQVTDEALVSLSYSSRGRAGPVIARVRRATGRLENMLGRVRVEAPPSVTLSSQSGSLGATVVNGLPEPVVVGLEARSDGSLELRDPPLLELAPESRTRVLLNVTAHRLGIHNVRLVVTDRSGRPLGSSVELPIRAAQVSEVIWVIIAGGAAMLFGAIAVRLFRRIRAARRTGGRGGSDGRERRGEPA